MVQNHHKNFTEVQKKTSQGSQHNVQAGSVCLMTRLVNEDNVDGYSNHLIIISLHVLSSLKDWVYGTLNANKWAVSCALNCLSCFSACSWCHLGSVCNGHLQWQGPKETRAAHFLPCPKGAETVRNAIICIMQMYPMGKNHCKPFESAVHPTNLGISFFHPCDWMYSSSIWIYLIFEFAKPSTASAGTNFRRVCKVNNICESWTDPRWVHNGPPMQIEIQDCYDAFFLALGLTYNQGKIVSNLCNPYWNDWGVSCEYMFCILRCNWNGPKKDWNTFSQPASAWIWWPGSNHSVCSSASHEAERLAIASTFFTAKWPDLPELRIVLPDWKAPQPSAEWGPGHSMNFSIWSVKTLKNTGTFSFTLFHTSVPFSIFFQLIFKYQSSNLTKTSSSFQFQLRKSAESAGIAMWRSLGQRDDRAPRPLLTELPSSPPEDALPRPDGSRLQVLETSGNNQKSWYTVLEYIRIIFH